MSGTSRFSEALLFLFLCACGSAEDAASDSTTQDAPAPRENVAPANAKPSEPPSPPPRKPKPPLDPMTLRPAYTEYLGQLTSTVNNPAYPGMRGTDLGTSFVRDGQLVFLFGDTLAQGSAPALQDVDLAATAPLAWPKGGMPKVTWTHELTPPGLKLGMMNVPVEGVAVGDDTYVFFATKFDFDTDSYDGAAIAKTKGLAFDQLQVLSEGPPGNFANVSVVVDKGEAFIFGTSGEYRRSAVHLARVPVDQLGDRSAWTLTPTPVIDSDCAGELSVRKHPTLALYLATTTCDEPRGTWLHLAAKAEGPWIAAGRIFGPEEGYERVMHAHEGYLGYDDGLAPPGEEASWGGEYGPYLVPEWFTQDGDKFGIVYTISSWVPYQVHLLRTWLVPPDVAKTPPAKGAALPKSKIVNGDFATGNLSGWLASDDGNTFRVFTGADGKARVTTFTDAKGDGAVGTLAQAFNVDATTSSLSFVLHGGDGRVYLKHDGEIVRSSRARRSAESSETPVKWNITPYRGETVTLVIEDDLTGAWGFVGARDFVLQ